MGNGSRWFIISNRLPFSYNPQKETLTPASGGLVTAIQGIKTQARLTWIGSLPGGAPTEVLSTINKNQENTEFIPVTLEKELYEKYYNGFCNGVLWPLFHYETEAVNFCNENWQAYQAVNDIFADIICKHIEPGGAVWVHDFHLFLLPGLLKKRKDLKVGFFLHVPFPSSEIYRQLPVRREILESLLADDLIGFHDYSYLQHFSSSVYNIMGINSSLLSIEHKGHHTHLGVYPVSIDTKSFQDQSKSPECINFMEELNSGRTSIKTILGVDRLDYTKGIDLKLQAFRVLLRNYPEMRGKVQFMQVAVPSRIHVQEYRKLKNRLDQLIGEINGEFSTPEHIPIKYIFNSIDFKQLLALYKTSEVLYVGSKRDGMNLVSLEYLAVQDGDNPGVIVLSEFTGAASTLSHAIPVNPWDLEESAEKLYLALNMPLSDRKKRFEPMAHFLKNYTATDWARAFMGSLIERNGPGDSQAVELLSEDIPLTLQQKLAGRKLVLVLDYDGVLVPIEDVPEEAVVGTDQELFLRHIQTLPHVDIIVISGRSSTFLDSQLRTLDIDLAAEHGASYYSARDKRWRDLVRPNHENWYRQALRIMQDYQTRTPGSHLENKRFSLSWHYRQSPKGFANFQAKKLFSELEKGLANLPVSVYLGNKIVEVRPIEADKGRFLDWYCDTYYKDCEDAVFVIVGDDQTDEGVFKMVSKEHISIKIGTEGTFANFRIREQTDVLPILEKLVLQIDKRLSRPPTDEKIIKQPRISRQEADRPDH